MASSLSGHSGARQRREAGISRRYLGIPGSALSRRPGMTCADEGCFSNVCMKLSFEELEMSICINAGGILAHHRRRSREALAGRGREVDSAAQSLGKNEERPMDFTMSPKQKEWLERVQAFMTT